MIKLTLGNSYSRIDGLTVIQYRELSNLLSYEISPQQAYFSGSFRRHRTLLGRRGDFPSGLVYLVQNWLNQKSIKSTTYDNRIVPNRSINNLNANLDLIPYETQQNAVKAALACYRGIICAPTGTGKSLIMAMLINALKLKTLIVVTTLELKRQLGQIMSRYFGNCPYITIENIDSPKLIHETAYDILICDEAHHTAARTYRILNKKCWNGIFYRFFLTATPFRSRNEEQMLMEGITGQVIYNLSYQEAVLAKQIVPVEAYYIEVPKKASHGYSWHEVYNELVVENEVRNQQIINILIKLNNAGISTLCLVKEIAHGDYLSKFSGLPFANGESEDCEEMITLFKRNEIKTLIATTGVCGEGVDMKPCEYVVIAGLGKSKNQIMQNIGRVLRIFPGKESGKVIIFKDLSHKWTHAHYREQVRILKQEYGAIAVKLEV